MPDKRFEKRTALVTGAAKGMGKQAALDLAKEGAHVIISDIDREGLDAAEKEFASAGYSFETAVCDVSDRIRVEKLIDRIVKSSGSLDILINNAGLLLPGTIEETTDEIIDNTVAINLKGVLYTVRAVTPHMKKARYGRIINVASITGKNGDNSTVFVYGATKGAVISLTRSVARQLGPFGVTCNAIAPHAVMTAMMQYWPEEKKKAMAEKIPVGRLGTEQDMSWLMCFLASDQAGFINGETININGGYYMD